MQKTAVLFASLLACLFISACIKDPHQDPPYHPPIDSTVCDAQSIRLSASDRTCFEYGGYWRLYKTYAPDGTIKYMQVTVGAFDNIERYHVKVAYATNGRKLFLLDSASLDTVFRASLDMQDRAISSQLRHPRDTGWYPEQVYRYNANNKLLNLAQFKYTYDEHGDVQSMFDTVYGLGGMNWSHPTDLIPVKGAYYLTEGFIGITDNVEILSYMGHINTQSQYRVEIVNGYYPGNNFARELRGPSKSYISWTYSAYCLEGEMNGATYEVNWRCPASTEFKN